MPSWAEYVDDTIEDRIEQNRERIVDSGTISGLDPLMVLRDGAGTPEECHRFAGVVLQEGWRVVVIKVKTEWAVVGSFDKLPDETPKPPYVEEILDHAATSYTITHNYGHRFVDVSVFLNAEPYSKVFPEVRCSDVNFCTILFEDAPAANAFIVQVRP